MKWFGNSRHREEDRLLYVRTEAILNEEGMERFLAGLKSDKSFQQELRGRVLAYLAGCEQAASSYRDRRLQEKAKALVAVLKELKIHTGTHFLVFPRNQTGSDLRHVLHPDYFILEMTNVSIDEHSFYFKAESELLRLVEKASAAYRSFQQAARRRKLA
ncbi:MAG: hypothetical protein WDA20_03840 [Desulfuromonadales bacterium]